MSGSAVTSRAVVGVVTPRAASDGAGVRLRRSLGGPDLPQLDPFLLLDEFRSDDPSDYLAGFPDHPHRGFETVTYVLAGSMEHADSVGNRGVIRAGGVQWMTAGRGIVHSEMPRQERGLLWGFQLWVNLPASHKMMPPRYQDLGPEAVPEVPLPGGGRARVLAGVAHGAEGPVRDVVTRPLLLDLLLAPGEALRELVPADHTALIYAFEGEGEVAGQPLAASALAVLGPGGAVDLRGGGHGLRALLIAGAPLGEPIARYGPFVMNTRQELEQAFADYQAGRLGR